MKKTFNLEIGYSDHSINNLASLAAISMGARIVEKHFTLNKNLKGPDHKASLSINELKKFIQDIRYLEEALGNGIKKPSTEEKKVAKVVRRSWHAKENIKKNEKISKKNVILLSLKKDYWNINIKGKSKKIY